jgi:hypothetical protein
MDEKSVLLAQARALLQQLDWAEASLNSARIDKKISLAASNGFAELFKQRRDDLNNFEQLLSRGKASAGRWTELQTHSVACGELFKECLGFLGAALLRTESKNKDNDVCEIADALLSEVTRKIKPKWNGVTVLAEANFYTETTGLIRLPFPDYGTWNLPIAVHELGHFVGERISDNVGDFPFRDLLQQKKQTNLDPKQSKRELSYLRELFSDLFAVFALGPSYICCCILLQFNPRHPIACTDGNEHPSYAKRVHLMFKVLDEMNESTAGRPYTNISKNLRAIWTRHLRSAQEPECLPAADIPKLEYQFAPLYRVVARFAGNLKYDDKGWDRAIKLFDQFAAGGELNAQDDDFIADVLNGQWLWRLDRDSENPNDVRRVNLQSFKLCRQIKVREEKRNNS